MSPTTKDFTLPPEINHKNILKFKAIFLSFFQGVENVLKRTKFAHYIHKETEIYFGWTGGAKKKKDTTAV